MELQQKISQAEKEILQLKSQIDTLELKLTQTLTPEQLALQKSYTKRTQKENLQPNHRICIISTNKRNKVLKIAENTLAKYDLCHYLMPNRSIKKILEEIEMKIVDYTMNDFCLILLGEEEFNYSNNYQDLVYIIRETLKKIHNTNFIICSPTFKCARYSNVYNWRVEHFNKILNEDVINHEYAYLIDSNLNLKYDVTMFHTQGGTVNNRGMQTIFKQVDERITEIENWIQVNNLNKTSENDKEDREIFFRK
uniref:OSK domain-containing protein n=2 Tax=Pectinophora gossypiella TaxID=13191 RepID=A0A1E1W6Z0_PECGO